MSKQISAIKYYIFLMILFNVSALLADEGYNNPAINPVKIKSSPNGKQLSIVSKKSTNAIIVISKNSKKSIVLTYVPKRYSKKVNGKRVYELAAEELQKYIKLATGINIPIQYDNQKIPKNKILILVGSSALTQKYGIKTDRLKPEGFIVKNFGKGIAIVGAQPGKSGYDGLYSTLFGVYDFLERFVGIRWYYPGKLGTIIPVKNKLIIPAIQYTDYPRYIKRQMFGWTAKGKMPGVSKPDYLIHALRYRAGGSGILGSQDSFNHTPFDLTKYFADYPEGFAINKNGKKISVACPPALPCYGNPQTRKLLLKAYDDFYKGNMTVWKKENGMLWGRPTEDLVPFSPPDHPVRCNCKYCRKLLDNSKPFHAQASQLMGDFISKLSWDIKKKYPNKILFYLPYYNYVAPPKKLKFADNLFTQVCLMYGNSYYNNKIIKDYYKQWIRGWKKITGKKVHIYAYPNWPGLDSPFPSQYPHTLKKFTTEFKGDIDGAFLCGPGNGGHPGIEGGVWAYKMPTVYCWFRLMWNSEFNVDAALDEQTKLLYGPASKPMAKILEMLIDKTESIDVNNFQNAMNIGPYTAGRISKGEVYSKVIVSNDIEFLRKQIADAIKLSGENTIYRERVNLFTNTIRLLIKDYEFFIKGAKLDKKSITAVRALEDFVIDGEFNESFWEKAEEHFFVRAHLTHDSTPNVKTSSRFAIAYNEDKVPQGIIYAIEMDEPDMNNTVIKSKKTIYQGNSIEFFIKVGPSSVYQFIIDSDGKSKDYFRGERITGRKNCPKFKIKKNKSSWRVELYMPFSTLGANFNSKNSGYVKVNIARNRITRFEKSLTRLSTNFKRANADKDAFLKVCF